jgi:hypothetical protein
MRATTSKTSRLVARPQIRRHTSSREPVPPIELEKFRPPRSPPRKIGAPGSLERAAGRTSFALGAVVL